MKMTHKKKVPSWTAAATAAASAALFLLGSSSIDTDIKTNSNVSSSSSSSSSSRRSGGVMLGVEGAAVGAELERYRSNPLSSSSSSSSVPMGTKTSSSSSSPVSNGENGENSNVIIVATVDGTFYGLSQINGEIIWKSNSSSTGTSLNDGGGGEEDGENDNNYNNNDNLNRMQGQGDHGHEHEHEDIIFAPLITTSTTRSSSTNSRSSWKTSAVPSIDGRVFLTLGGVNVNSNNNKNKNGRGNSRDNSADANQKQNNNNRHQTHHAHAHQHNNRHQKDLFNYAVADTTSTISMKELVSKSPFMDQRGRFYVSSRDTYAIALDRDTGDIVRVVNGGKFSNGSGSGNNHGNGNNGGNDDDSGDDGDSYWNGDYDEDLHDIFDDPEIGSDTASSCRDKDGDNGNDNDTDNSDNKDGVCKGNERNIVWMGRIDYSVTVHDARTGEVDVQFSTSEVLSLDDMFGGRSHNRGGGSVDGGGEYEYPGKPPLLTLPAGEEDSQEMKHHHHHHHHQQQQQQQQQQPQQDSFSSTNIVTTPGGKVALRDPKSGEILWIADDTFKTPVAFAVESSSGASLGVHVIPDAPSSHLFSKEYLSSELEKEIPDFFVPGGDDMGSTVFGALENDQLFALPLGGQRSNTRFLEGLPQRTSLSQTIGASKHPVGKLPHLSGRPDLHHQLNDRDNHAVAIKERYCDQTSANFPECLSYYSNPNPNFFYNEYDYVYNEYKYGHKIGQPQQPNGFRYIISLIIKFMVSWIPPAVALAFVVSFELGRRQKLREEAARNSELTNDSAKTQSGKSSFSEGVIDVSDEVLGFGGHGTVVYKGKLEGRNVAVKRMLKAYHASADREISLLIESDGHPNVVRYFLKEMRGDFVYLALELCDMNLQDLITELARKRAQSLTSRSKERTKQKTPIDDATKQLLFEIASGVKHIHSLRIVHRDLKPANILLARKNRTRDEDEDEDGIYQAFQDKDFIVKISDMGLGKQLLGQSSFGMSTMNNSIGIGMSRNEGSTIAGAGPGSVGWQAPEVMAHRLSPESPLLHDESGCAETMLEASPIDPSLNGRTSRSVDIFSLGCIFFCTVLPGSHPFGEWYEREANIMKNCPTTRALEAVTIDAADLILSMLHRSPRSRPTAKEVVQHPFFWNPLKRLTFLCDLSDRLESTDSTDVGKTKVEPYVIEKNAAVIVGTAWDTKLDPGLFNNVSKFRTYDTSSVRDCLRLIRNKSHHFDELSNDLKGRVATNEEELLKYFESVFPLLLMHCYHICRENLSIGDPIVRKYDIAFRASRDDPKLKDAKLKDTSMKKKNSPSVNVEEKKSNLDGVEKNDVPTPTDVIVWENSSAATTFQCRGWIRSEEEWCRRGKTTKKRDLNLTRCAEDGKFRTRLCNHWDESKGTFCPMRKKNKCDFAHGPVELRVKEGKRNRWGKLVDKNGNNSNPHHSGGEDT